MTKVLLITDLHNKYVVVPADKAYSRALQPVIALVALVYYEA